MTNQISKHEEQLIKYLENEILTTKSFIIRHEKTIEVLTEGDSEFTKMVSEIIEETIETKSMYLFRLAWLQGQLNQIKNLNK